MEVDANGEHKRRERDTTEGEDEGEVFRETEEAPAPQQQGSASGSKMLTLEDIMAAITTGQAENRSNFSSLKGEVTEARHDAKEAKVMAAKATTLAQETQKSLEGIESRLAKLEAGEAPLNPPPGLPTRRGGGQASGGPKRDWDLLGGEEGDTLIVGGFRAWADKEERQGEWEKARAEIPEELQQDISEIIVPNSQCSILILKIKKSADVKSTRLRMFDWGKKFRALTLQMKQDDETTPRKLYAQPSKPYEMRQRDSKTTGLLEGFKIVAGEERSAKLRVDLANGRIFYERKMLAERCPGEDMPRPRMETVQQVFPGLTEEVLVEKVAEATAAREKSRKGP